MTHQPLSDPAGTTTDTQGGTLAHIGIGSSLVIGALGFLLLDLGYLTASTKWTPKRRRHRNPHQPI